MRFFGWLIWLPLLIVISFFAVSNAKVIDIDLWPTDYQLQMPLSLFGFLIFCVGYLSGYLISKLHSFKKKGP